MGKTLPDELHPCFLYALHVTLSLILVHLACHFVLLGISIPRGFREGERTRPERLKGEGLDGRVVFRFQFSCFEWTPIALGV